MAIALSFAPVVVREKEMLLIKENGKWCIMGGYIDTSFYKGNSRLV